MNEKIDKLRKGLRSASQCDKEALLSYFNGEMNPQEKATMDEHLDTCPACLEIISLLREEKTTHSEMEWPAIERRMDDKVYAHLNRMAGKRVARSNLLKRLLAILPQPMPAIAYIALFSLFSIAGIYGFAVTSRPATYNLAQITVETTALTRGAETDNTFRAAMQLFDKQRYGEAGEAFKDFLQANPDHFHGHFYLGLALLKQAKKKVVWVSSGFEARLVKDGVEHLQTAFRQAGNNPFFREDCLWYLGKAYLMLENQDAGLEQFETLINLPDKNILRREKAKEIVVAIREMEQD